MNPTGRAPRYGLFGEFGVGNVGNDASCLAMIDLLADRRPDAALVAIARSPDLARERLGVETIALSVRDIPGRSASSSVVAKAIDKVRDFWRFVQMAGQFDAVIVPGTGMLEAPRQRYPGGDITWLLMLSIACRIRRRPLAWFAMGGGSYRSRLPAWTATLAASGASYRSFRDELSSRSLRVGPLRGHGPVCTDIVFCRPTHVSPPSPEGRLRLAIAVIDFTPLEGHGDAEERRTAYVERLAQVARRVIARGGSVLLVVGDAADEPPSEQLRALLRQELEDDTDAVQFVSTLSLEPLRSSLRACDVVVGSRYHVLLAAALEGKPMVAISHAEKDDEIMGQLGLGHFVRPIGTFDPDEVGELVLDSRERYEELSSQIVAASATAGGRVEAEADRMIESLSRQGQSS